MTKIGWKNDAIDCTYLVDEQYETFSPFVSQYFVVMMEAALDGDGGVVPALHHSLFVSKIAGKVSRVKTFTA